MGVMMRPVVWFRQIDLLVLIRKVLVVNCVKNGVQEGKLCALPSVRRERRVVKYSYLEFLDKLLSKNNTTQPTKRKFS